MGKNKWTQATQGGNEVAALESERTALCVDFLEAYYRSEVEEIMLAENLTRYYSLVIEYSDLYDANPRLGSLLYEQPTKLLQNFDDGARELQERICNDMKRNAEVCSKENIHVRVAVQGSALDCPETHPSIGQIRTKDVGRLLTIHGTVIRSGGIKMLDGERVYECTKCKHRFKMSTDLEMGNSIQLPSVCPSERTEACDGVKFKDVEAETRIHDYQEVKLQENMQALSFGSVPRSIVVILDDDLVDTIQAGDDVVVTGVLFSKWRHPVKDVRCDLVLTLRANFIRKTNKLKSSITTTESDVQQFEQFWTEFQDNPLKGRNLILQGICPQVFGLFTVKLAVALTLIGGVQRVNTSGARVRGESHLLLVGDPGEQTLNSLTWKGLFSPWEDYIEEPRPLGTGKSQFLKYAVKLSHRSVLTTGLGSTSAGLTVTAVKDGGEWVLEAGALVLADGGLCCIDEFDSIREPDRATIHEAMEQQTISVAKDLCELLTPGPRCLGSPIPKANMILTNIEVCYYLINLVRDNPIKEGLVAQSLTVNTTLSGPLLSRFDIVLVLMDTKNPEWDEIVSSHILKEHSQATQTSEKSDHSRFWTLQMLRSYLQHVRTEFMPVLTTEAEKVILCYYRLQRRSAIENTARTTVRMLESLIRLAQAHARLMFRKEVLRPDAIAAVICIESSMTTSAILDNVGNALHSTFAENPDDEYAKQEQIILAALKLDKEDDAECRERERSDPNATDRENPGTTSREPGVNASDRLRGCREDGIQPDGQPLDPDEDCVVLTRKRWSDERPSSVPDREGTAAPADVEGIGGLPMTTSRHQDGEFHRPSPPKQAKRVHSTQNIMARLMRGRGQNNNPAPSNVEAASKGTAQRFTEELLLSTQYSLP